MKREVCKKAEGVCTQLCVWWTGS